MSRRSENKVEKYMILKVDTIEKKNIGSKKAIKNTRRKF